jgi:transposase
MNQVISIRVPEETREEMKKLRRVINWNQEIRDFIQKKVDDKKKDDLLASVTDLLKKNPPVPSGSVAKLVRADRDRH